jgi:hypothetical protein
MGAAARDWLLHAPRERAQVIGERVAIVRPWPMHKRALFPQEVPCADWRNARPEPGDGTAAARRLDRLNRNGASLAALRRNHADAGKVEDRM